MPNRITTGLALAGGLWLGACSPVPDDQNVDVPPKPLALDGAKASTVANARFGEHADGLAATVKTLERSELLEEAFPKESSGECPEPQPGMPPPECDVNENSALDLSEEVSEMKEWVEQNVFNEGAVESSDGTTVVYRLQPDHFCPDIEDENGAITKDEDCVKVLTDMPVRVAVSSFTEGDLDLKLTAGTHHLADMELHAARVSVTGNLAGMKAAVQQAGGILGENVEEFPERFVGKVKLAALRHAADDYSLALGVVEALNVGMKSPTDLEYVDFKVGASDPLASARLSAQTGDLTLDVAVKALDIALAADQVFGEGYSETCDENGCTPVETTPKEGVASFKVPGLAFTGLFDADTDSGSLSNVKVDQELVAALDGSPFLRLAVSAATAAGFGASAVVADGSTTLTVEGGVEAKAFHDFAVLDAVFDEEDEAPEFLRSGWSSVAAGAPKLVVTITEGEDEVCTPSSPEGGEMECTGGSPSTFAVTEGSLTLDSSITEPLVVSAPQCLVENESAPEEPAHVFETVAAGACE